MERFTLTDGTPALRVLLSWERGGGYVYIDPAGRVGVDLAHGQEYETGRRHLDPDRVRAAAAADGVSSRLIERRYVNIGRVFGPPWSDSADYLRARR